MCEYMELCVDVSDNITSAAGMKLWLRISISAGFDYGVTSDIKAIHSTTSQHPTAHDP